MKNRRKNFLCFFLRKKDFFVLNLPQINIKFKLNNNKKTEKDEKERAIRAKEEKEAKDNEDEDEEVEEDELATISSKDLMRRLNFKKKYAAARRETTERLRTLIILPASLLHQWQSEIKSKFEANSFKVHVYHEANRKKYAYNLDDNDIVFTTYEIVSREIDIIDSKEEGAEIVAMRNPDSSPLARIKWKRVILDEAHRIKNHSTKANKSICLLQAKYRIAMTGTPVHNSLDDFYSLIKFLHFVPLNDFSLWKYLFTSEKIKLNKPGSVKPTEASIQRDRRSNSWLILISHYILLRRTKEDKLNNDVDKPIVDLPGKTIETIQFKLNPEERAIYNKIFKESLEKVNKILLNQQRRAQGRQVKGGGGNQSDIFVILLRLRQACCHMSLLSECLDKDELRKIEIETDTTNLEGFGLNIKFNFFSSPKIKSKII